MRIASTGWATEVMLRRLAGADVEDRGDHLVVRTPAIPEFYWGNYLLLAQDAGAEDLERWVATFLEAFPRAGHVALALDGRDPAVPASWAAEGSNLVRETYLTATAPLRDARPRDAGATVRTLEGDADWAAVAELDAIVYPYAAADGTQRAFRAKRWAEDRGICERGHGAWVGALAGDTLAAMAGVVSDGGGVARFQSVATHPGFRRRGLAGAVVAYAGALARERFAARTLVIAADPDDVAIDLYRSLGFADAEHAVKLQRAG